MKLEVVDKNELLSKVFVDKNHENLIIEIQTTENNVKLLSSGISIKENKKVYEFYFGIGWFKCCITLIGENQEDYKFFEQNRFIREEGKNWTIIFVPWGSTEEIAKWVSNN